MVLGVSDGTRSRGGEGSLCRVLLVVLETRLENPWVDWAGGSCCGIEMRGDLRGCLIDRRPLSSLMGCGGFAISTCIFTQLPLDITAAIGIHDG